MGKLIGFDMGLAVLAVVAKVVDKHRGGTLESVNLLITLLEPVSFPVV